MGVPLPNTHPSRLLPRLPEGPAVPSHPLSSFSRKIGPMTQKKGWCNFCIEWVILIPFLQRFRCSILAPKRTPFICTIHLWQTVPAHSLHPPWQFHFHLWFGGLNTSLIESSSPLCRASERARRERRNDPEIPISLMWQQAGSLKTLKTPTHANRERRKKERKKERKMESSSSSSSLER